MVFGLYIHILSPLCHIMPRFTVWEENTTVYTHYIN